MVGRVANHKLDIATANQTQVSTTSPIMNIGRERLQTPRVGERSPPSSKSYRSHRPKPQRLYAHITGNLCGYMPTS